MGGEGNSQERRGQSHTLRVAVIVYYRHYGMTIDVVRWFQQQLSAVSLQILTIACLGMFVQELMWQVREVTVQDRTGYRWKHI
jgi:hypothetical protein